MKEYDRHVALEPLDRGWVAELSAGWVVGGGVNGGYQLAVVGEALARTLPGRPDPLAVSAHYLSAAVPGPAGITTRVVREGRSVATLAADLWQGDDARLTVLATYGDLAGLTDDVRTTASPPDLPPLEDCVPNTVAPEELRRIAPLMDRFEMRFDPRHVG